MQKKLSAADQGRYQAIARWMMKMMPYLILLAAAWALKSYYSRVGSDELTWILWPVARMVEWVSASSFVYESATGFVDYSRRIIIAPGCAGVNFMIIAFCMTGFTVLPLSQTIKGGLSWLGFSAVSAYLLTLIANTIRIVIATGLYQVDFYGPWVTPARVHRLAGIVIYLFLLCGFFVLLTRFKAGFKVGFKVGFKTGFKIRFKTLFKNQVKNKVKNQAKNNAGKWRPVILKNNKNALIPLMWYMAMTIGVPVINGAASIGTRRFIEHSVMIFTAGVIVFLGIDLLQRAFSQIKTR